MSAVIALAGRRIDAPDAAEPRFPPQNVALVEQRLHSVFASSGATVLVSSAACGADLIALGVAGELHLRRRIVLPYEARRFRNGSVTDRPGDWGPLFDRIIGETSAAGDVVVLDAGDGEASYAAANAAVLEEAARLAAPARRRVAVIVWDGRSRGPEDLTAHFRAMAERHAFDVVEVLTI